jgi:hypothetical protein
MNNFPGPRICNCSEALVSGYDGNNFVEAKAIVVVEQERKSVVALAGRWASPYSDCASERLIIGECERNDCESEFGRMLVNMQVAERHGSLTLN